MEVKLYLRDAVGVLWHVKLSIDSTSDIIKDVSNQVALQAYIQEHTGKQITLPILAVIK